MIISLKSENKSLVDELRKAEEVKKQLIYELAASREKEVRLIRQRMSRFLILYII